MGFLDLFVEKVDDDACLFESESIIYDEPIEEDVNIDNVGEESMLEDIYRDNNLSDLSRSIFKVEQIINSLPREMPVETKRTTVLSIIESFGMSIEELTKDADNRINVIRAASKTIINNATDVINANNKEAENKKKEIEKLDIETSKKQTFIENVTSVSNKEAERIIELAKFIN